MSFGLREFKLRIGGLRFRIRSLGREGFGFKLRLQDWGVRIKIRSLRLKPNLKPYTLAYIAPIIHFKGIWEFGGSSVKGCRMQAFCFHQGLIPT